VKADGRASGLLVLTRELFRLYTLAYVPFGPLLDPGRGRGEFLERLALSLRPHLPGNTLFLRFDPPWEAEGDSPALGSRVLKKTAADIQPGSTVIVDLTPPVEDILASMKPKTRYNIKLAAKKGVTVSEGTEADIEAWYGLYLETSRRDGIAIHSKGYYAGLLHAGMKRSEGNPVAKLLLARDGDELLAGNIVLFWKPSAVYLTGASSGRKRNLMPTYALQWEAMKMAKEAGCSSYDLYGIPPSPNPGHPMYGLYQFKTGFSGRVLRRWGTWDYPYRPAAYALYAIAERARLFFYRSVRKRFVGKRGSKAGGGRPDSFP
jgi:lipid II:glycine glycyltransferase (peptidoglycan interpeptide bridge formation enzyme)